MNRLAGWGLSGLGTAFLVIFAQRFLANYATFWNDVNGFGWAVGITLFKWRSLLVLGLFFGLLGAALLTRPRQRAAPGWRRDLSLTLRVVAGLALAIPLFDALKEAYGFVRITLQYNGDLTNLFYILYPELFVACLAPLALWIAANLLLWRRTPGTWRISNAPPAPDKGA